MARQHGQTALERYRALGNAGGEVQTLWCLDDVLRVGGAAERQEAMRHARAALATVERLGHAYNLGRAYNYVALVAWAERNGAEASAMWQRALTASRAAGNVFLEPRILMNLGVTQEMLGERSAALKYYEESFAGYEALGLQQEAAWNRANAAAIRIQYGGDHREALRDLQNALAVFQKFGDKDFEAFARQSMSWYYRYAGDREAARRELTLASTIARERDLDTKVVQVAIDLARLDFDAGAYAAARDTLTPLTTRASATDRVHALIELGRTQSRLGRFEAAAAVLSRAETYAAQVNDVGSLPLLYFAQGELAYEAGRIADAVPFFVKSAAAWADDMPEAASVESRAYQGLIAGLRGQGPEGERALRTALQQAETMRRPLLAARCRLFLARLASARGRTAEALALVRDIPADLEPRLDPELQAQVQYSRGLFLRASGDAAAGTRDLESARAIVDGLIAALPEVDRAGVRQRPAIRLVTTGLSGPGNQ
jgi:tetratricopeptide (TPR) repeat protein